MCRYHLWQATCVLLLIAGVTACGTVLPSEANQPRQSTSAVTSVTPTATPLQMAVEIAHPLETAAPDDLMVSPSTCTPKQGAGRESITLAALLPISDPVHQYVGLSMQTALQIGVDQVNDRGGILEKPLTLITYDVSAGGPDQAEEIARKAIAQDCAVALIGGFHTPAAEAISAVSNRYQRPFLIVGALADSLTGSQGQSVFRLGPSASQLASVVPAWLTEVGDYNQDGQLFAVQIEGRKNAHTASLSDYTAAYHARAIRIEFLQVDLPSSDFSSAVARIVAFDALPDVIHILVPGEHALALQSQLLQAGIGPKKSTLIVNHETLLDHERFWREIPNGLGTLIMRFGPWHSTVNEPGTDFAQRFASYHSVWPDYHAFSAHDAVLLIADAISRAQTFDGVQVLEAFEISDISLAAGHYHFPYSSVSHTVLTDAQAFMWHQVPTPQVLILQYSEVGQSSEQMPVVWPPAYRTEPTPLVAPDQ